MITVHQRLDGRTDGQTTYHGNTALRYVSRGKNDMAFRYVLICQICCSVVSDIGLVEEFCCI